MATDLCPSLDATKSPNDRNSYRVVELNNGIQALLVSNADKRKQKVACACCVQVGSFSDPDRCQGLAHYCEHMIFLGSKKYPGEADFEEFLSENGGDSNAYTECEYTCFYFQVNCKALRKALDMFAQLFHEPLFTPDASSRELQAIESEFQKKRRSDSVRAETLFASFASADHPWRLFGWGNLQSLDEEPKKQGVDLHTELRGFFAEHYKASRMRLCVFGIESLDTLETAVCESFSAIKPSPSVPQLDFARCGMPLKREDLPRLVRVRPINDCHSLSMSWQLPSQLRYYCSKPEGYLSSLIGDEGEGSILSFLKEEGWATELTAGAGGDNFTSSSNSTIFTVEIELTDAGLNEWQKVVLTVFQYLAMLRDFPLGGLPAYLHDERKQIGDMSFRFLQEKDPSDLVVDLSERMLPLYHHSPAELLNAPWKYADFREDLVRSILDDLTVRNVFLMLMSSSYGRAGGLDAESDADESQDSAHELRTASRAVDDSYDGDSEWKLETRFGTEYLEAALAESWLSMWESAEPQRRLHVPPPNRFIATDFNILPDALPEELLPDLPCSGYDGFPIPQARRLRTPSLTSSEGLKMWHLPCAQQFEQPRSLLTLKLTSPYYALDLSSVRKEVLLELYCECLKDNLNETLYSASKAKLHCSFRESMYGLSLGAGGFSQKLLALVETMLQGLRLETYAMHRFRAQREELLRGYKNAWLKPQAHCAQLRKLLLLPATLRPAQREAELSACGESELSDFVKNFCSEGSWELLVSGNTRKDELTSWIHASLATQLPMRSTTVVEPDVVQLNAQTAAVWLQSGLDSTQTNSAVEIYFQLPGRDSWDFQQDRVRTRMLLELLEDMMYENVYDELRTKQQLGYSVGCNMRDSFGVLGFSIYVLSAVQRPPVLLERVDAFLKDFTRQLREWPSEKFASHIVGLGGRKLEPKRTLADMHGACWSEISFGRPMFDRVERETAVLGLLQPPELIELLETYLAPGGPGRACLITAVVPRAEDKELEALCKAADAKMSVTPVVDEQDYRSKSKLHPRRV
ncbi:unnamed protein product [Effrenium voratum]|nr:unnamed protein product [Effrenium voratum]